MRSVTGKSMLPTTAERTFVTTLVLALSLVLLPAALTAQTSTSPQGGAAIFSGPNAVCASSQSGISGSQNF